VKSRDQAKSAQGKAEWTCADRSLRSCLHLAHALVDICVGRERRDLVGGELEHADFALLGCYLGLDHIDLLLGGYSLGLYFLDELGFCLSVGVWSIAAALCCKGVAVGVGRGLTFCRASFGIDIL
jgi:hypothetical protein